jgi:hypothetical protein
MTSREGRLTGILRGEEMSDTYRHAIVQSVSFIFSAPVFRLSSPTACLSVGFQEDLCIWMLDVETQACKLKSCPCWLAASAHESTNPSASSSPTGAPGKTRVD